MSAQEKTANLVRCMVPLDLVEENEANPNQMSDREFDLLVGNMQEEGWTDPMYLAPSEYDYFSELAKEDFGPDLWPQMRAHGQKFRLVGGHHRTRAGMFLQLVDGPAVINLDKEFGIAQQELQMIRHNVIHGRMNTTKFFALYQKHEKDYGKEMMADMFGFAEQAELDKLIAVSLKSMPTPEMKQKFKEAAGEIKTVDDLTKLLNKLFSTHGDTLPWGYMVVDFGGKKSIWLRCNKTTFEAAELVGQLCVSQKRTMDDVFGRVLQLIASGAAEGLLENVLDNTPDVEIPPDLKVLPTKDNLSKVKGMKNVTAGAPAAQG